VKNLLLLFAKNPVAGTVKTRLAAEIGKKEALWVYEQLVQKTLAVLSQLPYEVAIFYTPEVPDTPLLLPQAHYHLAQKGTDLGARMQHAFQWGFSKGYDRFCLLGTDLWELTPETVQSGFEALFHNDFVLGPAQDGGYYLLGLKKPFPALFENMPWSTSKLFPKTLSVLSEETVAFLSPKNDIDTYADLKACSTLYKRYCAQFKSL